MALLEGDHFVPAFAGDAGCRMGIFRAPLAQNPKMADTFSGVILVMQANGLYMLKVPKLVHDEALVPLGREISRLRDEMAESVNRHAEVTRDTLAVCEKTRQVADAAATAARNSTKRSATAGGK